MKAVKMIAIINQGGEYAISVTYNEIDENGNIVKKNAKAETFYAVGDVLDQVKSIESDVLVRLGV